MSIIQDLTPTNIEAEKQKFFEKKGKYNPQFKYKTLATLSKVYKFGQPKPEYLKLAQRILNKSLVISSEEKLRALEGPTISLAQGKKMIQQFLKLNHMDHEIEILVIPQHSSKVSCYKNQFKIRKEFEYREQEFLAALYHELGTHALRRMNYTKQPFFNKKNKNNFKGYMRTEEGLAILHSRLVLNFQLAYYQALNYLATDVAQHHDFVTTFEFINQYLQNSEKSWWSAMHLKRGIYDTNKEGGFTKSIVYLEGMVKVWQYLKNSNFDLASLYWGKIDVEDVALAKQLNPEFTPQLPSFYTENPEKYQQEITKIAKLNYLDSI